MKGFGERLVKAREANGLTQKALAELLEISATRLNYWEKDKREPDLFMFSRIVTTLKTDANKLLGIERNGSFVRSSKYTALNSIGREKADSYIDALLGDAKYQKESSKVESIEELQRKALEEYEHSLENEIAASGAGVRTADPHNLTEEQVEEILREYEETQQEE